VADDPNAHADNLHGWSQTYDQLSGGSFSGEIRGAHFRSIHLFRESTNLSLRQSCVVRSQSWWFGVPESESDSFRVDSHRIESGAVAVRRGRQPFELITPTSFRIYGIVVDHEILSRRIEILHPEQGDIAGLKLYEIEVDKTHCTALRQLVQEMLREIDCRPEILAAPGVCEAMESSLLDAVAGVCVSSSQGRQNTRREVQHSLIVRNVRQFLLDHANRVISVPELCRGFNISRRTLQYAFEEVLGISPNAYLRILRLNGARRDLSRRDTATSVQQVAADWGFWHLSQFAKDYRTLFQELPSATLKRIEGRI
jgi:AraC family ethanolamine operon transcriptional activator